MGDGRIVFCDGNTGEMLVWDGTEVSVFATTGGSPWGAILGTDGAIYLTQGGNVPGSGDTSAVSGIQRINPDGSVELLFSEVDGYQLYGPNDLAFGPDGRLYFTESGVEQDFRFDVRAPGRLFAIDPHGKGEMLAELPNVYPNGIAFDAQHRLYWTESAAHRIMRPRSASCPTTTFRTAWPSPPTAGSSSAPRSPAGSPWCPRTARCSRRSASASTPPTACSPGPTCT
jgi:sugar lactone lactonase YvrE